MSTVAGDAVAVKHCGLCPQCVRSQQTVTTSNNLSAPCCRLYPQQADYVRAAAVTVDYVHNDDGLRSQQTVVNHDGT